MAAWKRGWWDRNNLRKDEGEKEGKMESKKLKEVLLRFLRCGNRGD
jgi:hypothetical protein